MASIDRSEAKWFKSTYSEGGSQCVEVFLGHDRVGVRDTKDHARGPELWFTTDQWDVFLTSGVWKR